MSTQVSIKAVVTCHRLLALSGLSAAREIKASSAAALVISSAASLEMTLPWKGYYSSAAVWLSSAMLTDSEADFEPTL